MRNSKIVEDDDERTMSTKSISRICSSRTTRSEEKKIHQVLESKRHRRAAAREGSRKKEGKIKFRSRFVECDGTNFFAALLLLLSSLALPCIVSEPDEMLLRRRRPFCAIFSENSPPPSTHLLLTQIVSNSYIFLFFHCANPHIRSVEILAMSL